MRPARGRVLVRKVETEETLPGGLVILTEKVREGMTAQQVEVVEVGDPVICEDGDCERHHNLEPVSMYPYRGLQPTHPCNALVGSWAIVAPRSLVETDEDGLYVVAQDDVLAVIS